VYSSITAARPADATRSIVRSRPLHERLPGYVFSELRPVDLLHESGRLAWSYGRPNQKPIKGVDVVLVREGRISLMLTFLDDVPAETLIGHPDSFRPRRQLASWRALLRAVDGEK